MGWRGINEIGKDNKSGKVLVQIDKRYFRPTEVDYLEGDASKAKEKLNWVPKISLESMISEMVQYDIKSIKLIMSKGYSFNLNKKKIWVAGHNGMVGKAIVKNLKIKNLMY